MSLFNFFLGLHIVNGTLALAIAPLAMVTVKGGRWHRRWGKIYFWAMAGVALSATVMCWLRSGIFLFLIAILSFYLALTGYRALKRKKAEDRPTWVDCSAAGTMALAGAGFIAVGLIQETGSARWVRVIFGFISLYLGGLDILRLLKPPRSSRSWMLEHMTRFLSAYIATVTAFSVVNFQFVPYFWRWMWPTVFGTVGITIWRSYYVRKFKGETHGIVQ